MRKTVDLTKKELAKIVTAVHEILYLDISHHSQPYWNPDKEWSGADVCQDVAYVLDKHGLVPEESEPY